MAAIDKLYIHNYYEYDDLRRWAIAYYPKLLFYFYRIDLTYKEYAENLDNWTKHEEEVIIRASKRFEGSNTPTNNLIDYYKKVSNYICSDKQAREEWNYNQEQLKRLKNGTLEDNYTFAVMNTPLHVDKKLKWICPVPCVRKYLHTQCGVNPKLEWLYKLFWRGKKHL